MKDTKHKIKPLDPAIMAAVVKKIEDKNGRPMTSEDWEAFWEADDRKMKIWGFVFCCIILAVIALAVFLLPLGRYLKVCFGFWGNFFR
ncbi:MAG: hypothetical protein WCS31_03490 [Verrucomicrobiae bacterium]